MTRTSSGHLEKLCYGMEQINKGGSCWTCGTKGKLILKHMTIVRKHANDRSFARKALSYSEKIAKIGAVYPEIFNEIRQFLALLYLTFTNVAKHLLACSPTKRWNYWTDLHQDFTRYSDISGAIKSYIYEALVHSVSECQSNESGQFAFFQKIGCYGNVPWQIRTKSAFIWWKDWENWSSTSGDIPRNTPVFWPYCTWRSKMSSVKSRVTGPNSTKFSHNIEASFALLTCSLR